MEQLIAMLVGLIGIPLVNFLKQQFNLVDKAALLLTSGVSVLLALAVLFVMHMVQVSDFTWENAASVFGLVMSTATIVYKLMNKEEATG